MQLLQHRLKVTLVDGRTLIGTMLAFDRYLNLVLADTEEFRTLAAHTVKRVLGLVVLRGETIVSVSVEAPPAQHAKVTSGFIKVSAVVVLIKVAVLLIKVPVVLIKVSPLLTKVPVVLIKVSPLLTKVKLVAGGGIARPAGRGMPVAVPGLAAPVAGIGGVGHVAMAPIGRGFPIMPQQTFPPVIRA